MGLFVRTVGLPRARLKIGMVSLAYNMRLVAPGQICARIAARDPKRRQNSRPKAQNKGALTPVIIVLSPRSWREWQKAPVNRGVLLICLEPRQKPSDRDAGDTAPLVGNGIGNYQLVFVNHASAGINHIGYVAISFVFIGCQ